MGVQKSEKRQRTKLVGIRLTPEEHVRFSQRCEQSGLSSGDYFRKQCLDDTPLRKCKTVTLDKAMLAQALGRIGKLGSDINQIKNNMDCSCDQLPNENLHYIKENILDIRLMIRKALGYDY